MEDFFTERKVKIGTFKPAFWPCHWLLVLISFFLRFDSVLTRFGDQCIVVRRVFFDLMGGFPDWPLFEDVGFMQAAREAGVETVTVGSDCHVLGDLGRNTLRAAHRLQREGFDYISVFERRKSLRVGLSEVIG